MIESASADTQQVKENDMILTSKRNIPLPSFKGKTEKLLFCQQKREEGPYQYAIAVGHEVTISSGTGRLLLRHDVSYDIRQLLHVVFPPSKGEDETNRSQEFFCVVGIRDMLFISVNDSHPLGFRVQFDIHAVYATSFGLLVERDLSTQKIPPAEDHVALYSLSHPLNELLAVIFKPRDSLTQWLFCWEKSEYTIVGTEDDIMLVFDRVNEIHSLLRIRITSEHEVRSAVDLLEKRRTEVLSRQATPNPETLKTTPLTTHRLQNSGASVPSSRLPPRASAAAPAGSLIRSVHTRSMTARLANKRSFPHPPHAPPADSPALSIFSPMSLGGRSEFASTVLSQPYTTLYKGITPKIQVFSRELQRQPDFDLLLAELCLDHIWTEPSRRDSSGEVADKIFLSQNVLSQKFANFFIRSLGQLRSIRVVHTVSNITTSGTMLTLSCRDATALRDGDLTVVLELDNSVSLYSGHVKCAVVVIPRFPITQSMLLYPTDDSSFVIKYGSKLTRIKLPPMFVNPLARDLFVSLMDALPREKAMHLMLDWKTRNRNYENDLELSLAEPQLHSAIRFILEQAGIVIDQHPRLPWRKIPLKNDSCEIDAKQRRPKESAEENWNRLVKFRESTNELRLLGAERAEKSTVVVDITVDSTAPLHGNVYAVVGAIHGMFEEWSLDCGLFHMKSQIVYYLHAATSVLGLTAYSSQYAAEFPDCRNCSYHVRRGDGLALNEFPSPYAHPTRNFSVDNPFSLWKAVAGLLQFHVTPTLAGSTSKVARMLTVFGVGLGAGRLTLMADVHRLLGRNWERRLRLEQDQIERVAQIMFSNTKTPAQKSVSLISEFGFTRWTIEQLPPSIGLLLGSIIVGQHTSTELFQFKRPQTTTTFPQPEEMAQIARIRWPRDVRRDNVRSMLDSTKPVLIATQHLDAGTDGEIREAQEQFLSATWTRYLCQSFGRAFFEFRTTLPNPTEPLYVPDLCLSARIYPSNLTYDLTVTEPLKQLKEWGEFYNGTAAGLRIVGADVTKVDHEWLTLCHSNDKVLLLLVQIEADRA
ncbi:hypothetical protein RB195_015996 [Necator americanus]|uniref:Anaphase-promoting complex subunit 1 n=1 Tax=Necator americanus TaxID=51031 RepID=A0ABR1E743_NECAM